MGYIFFSTGKEMGAGRQVLKSSGKPLSATCKMVAANLLWPLSLLMTCFTDATDKMLCQILSVAATGTCQRQPLVLLTAGACQRQELHSPSHTSYNVNCAQEYDTVLA